jgi:hypothetical protein
VGVGLVRTNGCTLTWTASIIWRRLPSNRPGGVPGAPLRSSSVAVPLKMGVSTLRGRLRSLMGTVLC